MSIRKRGNTYTITVSLGYDEQGRQIRKNTTYTPPEGVTPKKAEKLAKEYDANVKHKLKKYELIYRKFIKAFLFSIAS